MVEDEEARYPVFCSVTLVVDSIFFSDSFSSYESHITYPLDWSG